MAFVKHPHPLNVGNKTQDMGDIVIKKIPRYFMVQKKPHGRGLLELAVVFIVKCLYLYTKDVRSIIAVVVQNYLAGAVQIYIDYPPIYLPSNFKVKIV
tara:strand:+ start:227 stop:520 length:294 start_codon:yes stop_codon:yes gene_type:complete